MEYFLKLITSRTVLTCAYAFVAAVCLVFGVVLPDGVTFVEGFLAVSTIVSPILAGYFRVTPKSTFKE